ncbi:uncharacterized protein LOC121800760 [Salvia splendens]|uniref:uncharacterized protein LOC121800760 n=1 Tax=Salvia splendens TaxID=180675 RepID=UPI001C257592|nr:uncharacterized protein LOC121800760 [Salvia splendens]
MKLILEVEELITVEYKTGISCCFIIRFSILHQLQQENREHFLCEASSILGYRFVSVNKVSDHIFFVDVGAQESTIGFLNFIPVLKGNTYASWRSKVLIGLGVANLDYALRTEQPAPLIDESSDENKWNFERWEHSNRMSLMIMQHAIPENFRGTVPKEATTKEFLEVIDMNFASNEKAETASLMHKLVTMRYNGRGEIWEHIMEMSNTTSKLTTLNLTISDDQLVHLVMISLPHQFDHFKVSYNTVKDKWSLNELISHCVQEEERMKQSNGKCSLSNKL